MVDISNNRLLKRTIIANNCLHSALELTVFPHTLSYSVFTSPTEGSSFSFHFTDKEAEILKGLHKRASF